MSYLTDHAEDLLGRSEYTVEATAFLSPAEQREIFDALPHARGRLVFWGGALGAQRRCAFFLPDWILTQSGDAGADVNDTPVPDASALASLGAFTAEREAYAAALDADLSLSEGRIVVVCIRGSGFVNLGHRDYMGAILGLGIKRTMLGDIVLKGEHECEVFCTEAACRVIAEQLRSIGRDTVRISSRAVLPGERIERRYEELAVTVASMRLDCLVRELAKVSREAAQKLIVSGAVELDYVVESEPDTRVAAGSTVSVRGTGKFTVAEQLGTTRKDRIRVKVRRYV